MRNLLIGAALLLGLGVCWIGLPDPPEAPALPTAVATAPAPVPTAPEPPTSRELPTATPLPIYTSVPGTIVYPVGTPTP